MHGCPLVQAHMTVVSMELQRNIGADLATQNAQLMAKLQELGETRVLEVVVPPSIRVMTMQSCGLLVSCSPCLASKPRKPSADVPLVASVCATQANNHPWLAYVPCRPR